MTHHQIGIVPAQLFAALLAHGQDLHGLAACLQIGDPAAHQTHDRRVEATAQPPLGRQHHQKVGLIGPGARQKTRGTVGIADRGGEAAHDGIHPLGIGATGLRRILRAAQFGGGDHLHRLGDLAGRFDRLDPVF